MVVSELLYVNLGLLEIVPRSSLTFAGLSTHSHLLLPCANSIKRTVSSKLSFWLPSHPAQTLPTA